MDIHTYRYIHILHIYIYIYTDIHRGTCVYIYIYPPEANFRAPSKLFAASDRIRGLLKDSGAGSLSNAPGPGFLAKGSI